MRSLGHRLARLEQASTPPRPSTCASCGHPLPASRPLTIGSQTLRILPPLVMKRLGDPLPLRVDNATSEDVCGTCGRHLNVRLVIRVPRPGREIGAVA